MKIRELLGAFGPTLAKAQPLSHAEKLLTELRRDYLTVTDRSGRAVGFITVADVSQAKLDDPSDWSTAFCSAASWPTSQVLKNEATIPTPGKNLGYAVIESGDGSAQSTYVWRRT